MERRGEKKGGGSGEDDASSFPFFHHSFSRRVEGVREKRGRGPGKKKEGREPGTPAPPLFFFLPIRPHSFSASVGG